MKPVVVRIKGNPVSVKQIEISAMHLMADVKQFCKYAFAAMLAGMATTLYFSLDAKVDADEISLERYASDAEEVRMHLLATLASHEQVLLGAAAFFDSSASVTRDEWKRYTHRIQLSEHFKSVQGIGYSQWIPRKQLASHIASVRREGFPDYEVWPKQDHESYTAIVYLEPFTGRNLRAFGYNMYSEPTRRAAMDRARDTDAAALSGKVKLVQETSEDVQAGTLMYLPLYRQGMPHETEAQRRAALYGWIYSPFRMKDMIENALGAAKPEESAMPLQLSIYDGSEVSDTALLYTNRVMKDHAAQPVTIRQKLEFGGNEWTLLSEHYALNGAGLDYSKAKTIFFSGTLTSILLYFLITALTQSRAALNKAKIAVSELRRSEENLRVLAKNESVLIWLAGPDKQCTYFNQVWLDFTGRTMAQELGEGWAEGVHPDDREDCVHAFIMAFDARREFTLEYRLRHHSGEYRWIVDHGVPRYDSKGEFLGFIGSGVDINDKKESEAQLVLSMFAMDKAFDAIYWLDKDGRIRYVNKQSCETLGYTKEELTRLSVPDLDPDFPVDQWKAHWESLKKNKSQLFETRHRRKDGSIIPVEVSANHVQLGELEYNIAFCRDISKRKEIEQEIYSLAFFDPLTHLPNRRMLSDRLSKSLATSKRNDAYGALLFLDLDNFKPINDKCGHEVGDQLLIEVARRLTGSVREIDTVARFGGDEFVIVLGDLSSSREEMQKQAFVVAEKIITALAAPYHLTQPKGHEMIPITHECTSSIGITLFDGKNDNQYDILSHGDSAMYSAKEAGRNRVAIYTPAQNGN
jgi:diguanylate cyclase (GGDEF)-like protein/PAS domain S-box-containing protein